MRINLANIPVLCLNSSYEALCLLSAKRAFTQLAKGIAVMEKTSTMTINRGSYLVPSVIRLVNYRRVPRRTRTLSRKSILARDSHTCQYCMSEENPAKLTLDHIMPKSRGGLNEWQNLIAACFSCNNKKGDRTPEEAGMPLLRRPKPFNIHTSRNLLRESALKQRDWQQYLYYENDTPQVTQV